MGGMNEGPCLPNPSSQSSRRTSSESRWHFDRSSRRSSDEHRRDQRRLSFASQLQLLQQAVEVINSCAKEPDYEAAFDGLQLAVSKALDCEVGTLYLLDERTKRLWAHKARHHKVLQIPFGSGVVGLVTQYGHSMSIPVEQSCKQLDPSIDKRLGRPVRSILSCPVCDVSGKQVAVLEAVNKRSGTFSETDQHMLQLLGSFLGNSLTLSRLQLSASAEQSRMTHLREGFRLLQLSSSSLGGLVNSICRTARELIKAQHMLLLFMDQLNNKLWTHWALDSDSACNQDCIVQLRALEEGPLFEALSSKHNVAMHDVAADSIAPDFAGLMGSERLASLLVQPIVDARTGSVLAVLLAANKSAYTDATFAPQPQPIFNAQDEAALSIWATEVAAVLAGRALDISFASALASTDHHVDGAEMAVKAQLLSYASQQLTVPAPHNSFAHALPTAELSQCDTISTIDYSCAESSASSFSISAANSSPALGLLESLESTPGSSMHPFDRASEAAFCRGWRGASARSDMEKRRSDTVEAGPVEVTQTGRSSPLELALAGGQDLLRWDMDLFQASPDELNCFVADVFLASGLVEFFALEEWRLSTFIASVASKYQPNPYHNLVHACYVLHATYLVIHASQASCALSKPAQLALLIAALCHDLDHDGHTNDFHVATKSQLALFYNDSSVLENHHCSLTYSILNHADCKLLGHLDQAVQQEIRRLVIGAIMATDSTNHFALTSSFERHGTVWSAGSQDDALLLCKAILHAADLSNPARPFPIHAAMSLRLHAEFKAQVEDERGLGLKPKQHMEADSPVVICRLEVSFIETVALPIWEHLAACFPALTPAVLRMEFNHNLYQAISDCEESIIDQVYKLAESNRSNRQVSHPRWISGQGEWTAVQSSIRKGKANPVGVQRLSFTSSRSGLLEM